MRKISIIIPVWNGEKYVAEAIESALRQDYQEKEIIVVNDGSTDRTAEVIQQFAHQIRVLTQENKGLGASRNAAVRISTGDYLAFLDHDDIWTANKLSLQMDALIASKEDPLIFSQVKQFICPTMSEEERKKIIVNLEALPGHIAGTLLISKNRFQQIGEFIEEKQLGEFIEWYLRALEQKVPMFMVNEVTYYRRIHQDNMGRRDLSKRGDYLRILKSSLDRRRVLV